MAQPELPDPDKLTEDEKEAWRRACETPDGLSAVIKLYYETGAYDLRIRGMQYGLRPGVVLGKDHRLKNLFEAIGEVDGLRRLADLLIEEGIHDDAAHVMAKTRAPLLPRDYLRIGEEHIAARRYREALEAFRQGPNPTQHIATWRKTIVAAATANKPHFQPFELVNYLELIGETPAPDFLIELGRKAMKIGNLQDAKAFFHLAAQDEWPRELYEEYADALLQKMGGNLSAITDSGEVINLLTFYYKANNTTQVNAALDHLIRLGFWSSAEFWMKQRGVVLTRDWYIRTAEKLQDFSLKIECLIKGRCMQQIRDLIDTTVEGIDNISDPSRRESVLSRIEYTCEQIGHTGPLRKIGDVWKSMGKIAKAAKAYEAAGYTPDKNFFEDLAAYLIKLPDGKGVLGAVSALTHVVRAEALETVDSAPPPVEELVIRYKDHKAQ